MNMFIPQEKIEEEKRIYDGRAMKEIVDYLAMQNGMKRLIRVYALFIRA